MSFYQLFRNILGLPDKKPDNYSDRPGNVPKDEFRNPIWNLDEDDDDDDDFRSTQSSPFGFQVFSNPIEIHRFFEHQMEEMMRSFQNHVMTDSFSHFGMDGLPALGAPPDLPETNDKKHGSLREHYLKPDFKKFMPQHPSGYSKETKSDKDLDDRINASGLDSILQDRSLLDSSAVKVPDQGPQIKSFGRSVVTQTIRRPDGMVEHHRTIRDNQGNEETTITHQIGDQVYTVTTQLDPNGVRKRTENFINIDEGNLKEFEEKWNHNTTNNQKYEEIDDQPKPHNWFPFDKFFR